MRPFDTRGKNVIEAFRDNMEVTLREIMSHAPEDGSAKVPEYGKTADISH
jgi:hypothetical protein